MGSIKVMERIVTEETVVEEPLVEISTNEKTAVDEETVSKNLEVG